MDAEAIVALLRQLRCQNIRVRSKWVSASCPLAAWRHQKGTDRSVSFGIEIVPKGESRWNCYSCQMRGTLNELLWALKRYDGLPHGQDAELVRLNDAPRDFDALKARLGQAEQKVRSAIDAGGFVAPTKRVVDWVREADLIPTIPEEHLDLYFQPVTQTNPAGEYLREKRNLPAWAWEAWGLRWHPHTKRVAIPIRDYKGRLKGITGRSIRENDKTRWLHSLGFKRDYLLFGEQKLDTVQEVGYVVEGHFDTIYLWSMGYRGAVGVMGSYVSPYQIQQFVRFFKRLVIFRDGDKAGKDAAYRWLEALSPRIPTTIAEVLEGRDPDEYSAKELEERLGPPQKTVTDYVPPQVDTPF